MTDTKTLTLTRTFSAKPARVLDAMTSADARMSWGPPGAEMVVVIQDQPAPAPGVREVSTCGPVGNPYVTVQTDWIEMTEARLSYAETLIAEGEAFATSLAIFDLTPDGAQTRMVATIFVASFAGAQVLPEVEGGWTHALGNLAAYLA